MEVKTGFPNQTITNYEHFFADLGPVALMFLLLSGEDFKPIYIWRSWPFSMFRLISRHRRKSVYINVRCLKTKTLRTYMKGYWCARNHSPSNIFHRHVKEKEKHLAQMLPSRDYLPLFPLGWQKNWRNVFIHGAPLGRNNRLPPSTFHLDNTIEISAVSRIHTMPIEIHPSLVQTNKIESPTMLEKMMPGKTRSPKHGKFRKNHQPLEGKLCQKMIKVEDRLWKQPPPQVIL